MGITLYDPAPGPLKERQRERAVELSGALALRDDPELQVLVTELRAAFGTAMATISVVHSDWQYVIAAAGLPTGPTSRRTSLCGHVIHAAGRLLCVPDATLDPRFAGNPTIVGMGVRFYAAAPLLTDAGLPLGAICVIDIRPGQPLTDAQQRLLIGAADAVMVVLAARNVAS